MQNQLTYNKDGKPEGTLAPYQPSKEEQEMFLIVKDAYETGDEILNHPFEELDGVSVIERMNQDQRTWLSWSPSASGDSDNDWRWTKVRPITRNKIISTAAHLTSNIIKPKIYAQNNDDEEDKFAGYVMDDLLEYNIQRSDYEIAFLYGVLAALVNPVAYFKVEYAEAHQEILTGNQKKFKKKTVIDDELSGFQFSLLPADEILITNAYEHSLQKQHEVIHRRRISYEEAEAYHGEHENWQYVQRGVQHMLAEDALFYQVSDTIDEDLVEEIRYYCRKEDREIVHVNGIYLSNPNTKYNPFRHRTNKNKPKIPMAKFGAEPIDSMRFYFYRSLVAKMSNDQELYDRMWQMAMDATAIQTYLPIVTIGAGKIDKSVVAPATITDFRKDTKVQPLQNIVNPEASFVAAREAERSLAESSQDPQVEGKVGPVAQTARQSLLIQQNAETNLTLITKMIGNGVKEIGKLMIDDIIRFQTTGEVNEILAGTTRMKYQTFIVQGKVREGKNVSSYIRFTDRYAGEKLSKQQIEDHEMRLFEEAGDDKVIYEVNPSLFAKLDFLVNMDYEQMTKKNTAFEKAIKLEIYDRAIMNPYVDQELVTRDFLLEPYVRGEASKYIKQIQGLIPQEGEQPKGRLPQQMMASVGQSL